MTTRQVVTKSDWVRAAALHLLERNRQLAVWDAVVISTALAERSNWLVTKPERAVDNAFGHADVGLPPSLQRSSEKHPDSADEVGRHTMRNLPQDR